MLDFFVSLILFICWILLYIISPYRSRRVSKRTHIKSPPIPRSKQYIWSMIDASCFGILALLVAYLNQLTVFGQFHIDYRIFLLATGFLALNMLFIEPLEWKYISDEIKQRYGSYSPHKAKEWFIWIAVSLITAISEEILYRAVFFGIFYQLTDNYWLAGLISAVFFALAHWKYGLTALPSAFFVALGLQYFVRISGGLYVSITIHFFHNLVNGIVYGRIWKKKLRAEVTEQMIPNNREMAIKAQKIE